MHPIFQRLHLYTESNDSYIFLPDGVDAPALMIHRSSGEVALQHWKESISSAARRSGRNIYGILGIISLTLSDYVILLTGRELQGRLMGHDIYRATKFDILPINPNISAYNSPHPVEAHLLALVRSHLEGGNFLFSYDWDLTRRLQTQWETRDTDTVKALYEVVDDKFFWNKFLQSRLIEAAILKQKKDLGSYILPLVYGTFDIRPAFINGRHMQLGLISRRSRYRAGTRYFRRGVDHSGHVANFNESEQLLLVEKQSSAGGQDDDAFAIKVSFVQIRGSIPIFWAEVNTLRYKPDLQIMDLQETLDAMRMHLQEQVSKYGEQAIVNLVNQKGHELPVKEAFERYISQLNLPSVKYHHFDFHRECKNMRWDRISILIDQIKDELEEQGYFQLNASQTTPVRVQSGTVRTNCMDNLDRTNVVQAALAKWTLNKMLQNLGIIPEGAGVDDYEPFSKDFREIWADHGDGIARAYGGSDALKSDYTRTNKRTRKGLLEDGYKSVIRYLKNNYFDGARQDAFDLVTGSYIPRKNLVSALYLVADTRPLITRSMPLVASFALFMICAGLTLPRTSDYSLMYYFVLWFFILALSLTFILAHGVDYVSWPRLNPPTNIIYYNGPGYRSGHHGKGVQGKFGKLNVQVGSWLANGKGKGDEIEMGVLSKKRVD
ncbi:hypothetical protein AMATHDRAFT_69424 [Amanita thiersii Skay4041]|uniref:SAC domain-containing protein n=1 Tax=Amanita thiersii Skay4041 TaxID=703135 RepID=A0A2A9N9G0_9AGAR|nr:hypothetical protein AMATHDRAFT_69424 [Amanita thiersii Skay4041]